MSGQRPKILLAPMNMAAMPVTLAKALRERGYEAAHIQYTGGAANPLGYELDRVVSTNGPDGRIAIQMATLQQALDEGFDIFHFWNRSLTFRLDFGGFSGIDLPLIKARGRRIAHRFTGFDLRLPSRDLAVNPHSPFRYDQPPLYDERLVMAYQDFLREYVDRFFVQDPELGQFFPEADIIPRALDLSRWEYVGVERSERPLVVHAPTNPAAKGTRFVLAAVEQLRDEGLQFDFKLVRGVANAEARRIYSSADIIVDQILIGATGVLTLEAWALGKPVVVNLRRDLFEPFYGTRDLPVVNANPDTIVDGLRQAIKDADLRQDLAVRGRALVEERHDIAKVIDQYVEAYEAIHAAPPVAPTGYGDLRYLTLHMRQAEAEAGFWGRWIGGYRRAYERALAGAVGRRLERPLGFRDRLRAAVSSAAPLIVRDIRNTRRDLARAFGFGRRA